MVFGKVCVCLSVVFYSFVWIVTFGIYMVRVHALSMLQALRFSYLVYFEADMRFLLNRIIMDQKDPIISPGSSVGTHKVFSQ